MAHAKARLKNEIRWTTGEHIFDSAGFEYEIQQAGSMGCMLIRLKYGEMISLPWKEINNDKVFKFHK